MSKENETKETVEFAFDKMEQYFNAAKAVLDQYGGDVAEVGLNVLRIEAASELLAPLIATIIFGIIARIALKGFTVVDVEKIKRELRAACSKGYSSRGPFADFLLGQYFGSSADVNRGSKTPEDIDTAVRDNPSWVWTINKIIRATVGGISGFVLFINIFGLINIWAWIGLFYPELYAVHKFIL